MITPYRCFFLEVARHPEVRAKLAASLPRLSLDAPLIDGKTVREDPKYEYLNACIKGTLCILSFTLLNTGSNLNQQKTSASTPSPQSSGAAPYKSPPTWAAGWSCLPIPWSQPHTGRCISKPAALYTSPPFLLPFFALTVRQPGTNHLQPSNANYWPQAQRFWPERFLAEDSPLNNNGAPKAEYV